MANVEREGSRGCGSLRGVKTMIFTTSQKQLSWQLLDLRSSVVGKWVEGPHFEPLHKADLVLVYLLPGLKVLP